MHTFTHFHKAFVGWSNSHLRDRNLSINTFETDLSNGVLLWNLLEIISNKPLPKLESANPKTKFQMLGNLGNNLHLSNLKTGTVFKFLEQEKLKLVNIGPEDLVGFNNKLALGFLWTLILRYQIQKGASSSTAQKAKQDLMDWVNSVLSLQNISIADFKTSFSNGRAFCGLVNNLRAGAITPTGDAVADMTLCFDIAEKEFSIPKLLEPEYVVTDPDELSILCYVYRFHISNSN